MRFHTLSLTRYNRIKALSLCIGTSLLSLLLLSFNAQAQKLSPSEAADSARHSTGGKILKVKSPKSGDTDYRIKVLLPEGKVRNVTVDGNNGRVHNSASKKKK